MSDERTREECEAYIQSLQERVVEFLKENTEQEATIEALTATIGGLSKRIQGSEAERTQLLEQLVKLTEALKVAHAYVKHDIDDAHGDLEVFSDEYEAVWLTLDSALSDEIGKK